MGWSFWRIFGSSKTIVKQNQGVFNGPEIRHVLCCSEAFKATFNTSEAEVWSAFCEFVSNFLRNNIRFQEYANTQHCGKTNLSMGCRMSLKFHFLTTPRIQIAVSDEHGEHFYQDISEVESRHQENLTQPWWATTAGAGFKMLTVIINNSLQSTSECSICTCKNVYFSVINDLR